MNTVITITVLGLALVAASFAGTIMIGSANAQSQQGSAHACPTGFTLSQGQCIVPVSYECQPVGTPPLFQGVPSGNTCRFDTDLHYDGADPLHEIAFVGRLQGECIGVSGQFEITGTAPLYHISCVYNATPTCPGGITPASGQCVTRPGQA